MPTMRGVNVTPRPAASSEKVLHQSALTAPAAASPARLAPRLPSIMPWSTSPSGSAMRNVRASTPNRTAGAAFTRPIPSRTAFSTIWPRAHHTKNAAVRRRSCSQDIHFNVHFVAASPPRGSSVRLLFA